MRFLVRATIGNESGNALVRGGKVGKVIDDILGEIKPEAVYFTAEGGHRTLYLVVNVDGSHQVPAIAEPLWLGLGASVEFIPAMTKDDFAKAAPSIEKAAKKFPG